MRKRQSPVMYLFCLSDIAEEYLITNIVTQTIIFKDKVLNINYLSQALVLYQDMIFPACIPLKSINLSEKPLIYIRIENDYLNELTFLKLLPLLNQMNNYVIHYQSDHVIGRHLINPHIKIIPGKQNIREEINRSDMVIGSGMVAAFAIQQGKKVIVVGERGYGGLVTKENLEYHLSNCFQGRNGGKLDENIPLYLVQKAIEEKTDTSKTSEQLSLLQAQNENKLIQQVKKIISINNRVRSNDPAINFILNPDYNMVKKKKRIWLLKQVFGNLYKSINESESAVISYFQQPHSIPEVLNIFPTEYKDDISEYIRELIIEKILIPVKMNL